MPDDGKIRLENMYLPKRFEDLKKLGEPSADIQRFDRVRPKLVRIDGTDYCRDSGRSPDGNQLFCKYDEALGGCGTTCIEVDSSRLREA